MQRNTMDWAKLEIIAAFQHEVRLIKGLVDSMVSKAFETAHQDENDSLYNALLAVDSLLHTLETSKIEQNVDRCFALITMDSPIEKIKKKKK